MRLFFIFFVLLSTSRVYSQNLVDITVGGSYAFTNTSNVISTNHNGTGVGIGWSANLYTDAEMGPTNDLLSLRWMIDYATTTAGSSFLMTDVSIYLFEYGANSVFPTDDIPDLITNGAVNVFQGDLLFTPPASSPPTHCEVDVPFSVPFSYTAGNSLVVYIEKLSPYTFGSVSPYYGYMPGSSGLRVLSNWNGSVATPLNPTANNSNQDRYALIKFNETSANLCATSPCIAGAVSSDEFLCSGTNTATLSIDNPNSYDLQWQILNGSTWENIPGANSETLIVNNIQTTTQYQVLVSSSTCSNSTSDIITVNVTATPSPPDIDVVTQPICPNNTGSVSFVNLPSPESWTIIGNPTGTISGTAPTGIINNLTPDTYFFSISVNGCTSTETINPTIITPPQTEPPLINANTFNACDSDFQTVSNLPVTYSVTPNISLDDGINISSVTLSDTLITGIYYVSQIDDVSGCSISDSLSINVTIESSNTPQIANNNINLCEADSPTLGDLGVTGNGGVLNYFYWDGISLIPVTESDLALNGTYYVTQIGPGNNCESLDSLELFVSLNNVNTPTTSNGNPVFCLLDGVLVDDLNVNGTNLLYFYDNGSTISPVNTSDVLQSGNYYIIEIDPLTNCQSGDSLMINVGLNDPLPPSTLNANQFFCETENAVINDLEISGTNINWYDSNGNPLINTTILVDNTTYFATQTTGTPLCESSAFLELTASIESVSPPSATNLIQSFCENENATLQDLMVNGNSLTWYDAATNGNALNPSTTLVNGQSYFVSQTINGCESIALLEIQVIIQTEIDGGFTASEIIGCAPLNIILTANTVLNDPSVQYTWLIDGVQVNNNPVFNFIFENEGCYDLQLDINSDDFCFSSVETMDYICVYPEPVSSFTANPNTLTSPTQQVNFINQSTNASQFYWNFGDGNYSTQTNPNLGITITNESIEVFLTAISAEGCESISSLILTLNESYDLYVPNTFTPDADEHNQTWGPVFIQGFDKYNFQLLVFNRWGEIVWESLDADARWDGTYTANQYKCPDGIYTWKILYKQKDTDEKITRTGHVTIMR